MYFTAFLGVLAVLRCSAFPQDQPIAGGIPTYEICDEGLACIPWPNCVGGENPQIPENFQSLSCPGDGNMCCTVSSNLFNSIFKDLGIDIPPQPSQDYDLPLPDAIIDPVPQTQDTIEDYDLPSSCGHASYDCVPYFQCKDGVINTDGSGLIDIRTRPSSTCRNAEYPDIISVCCRIPGAEPTPPPVESCPKYQECVEFSLCSADGQVVTDGRGIIDIRTGYESCYLPSGVGGRCCTPPAPHVDVCPGESHCIPKEQCDGQALDAVSNFIEYVQTALWSTCAEGGRTGICCIPTKKSLEKCPGESVCELPESCSGTALDVDGNYVQYNPTGNSWAECESYEGGVCCINPKVPEYPIPDRCGVRNVELNTKIQGPAHADNEASFGEFPWQSILFFQNYTFICGGSIIGTKHILTGAHCVKDLNPGDIRVRVGEWKISAFDEPLPYEDKNVQAIHIHQDFNRKNLHNDVAILELVYPLEFQYHINRVCLPEYGNAVHPGTYCFTTGWGKDSFTGSFQHILKKIEVPYIQSNECQNLLRKTRLGKYFRLHNSFTCAGGEENKDACFGDGGGPLVCEDPTTHDYVLAGITAWGIGCGNKNVPGVYVDVQKFANWIHGYVNNNIPTKH